MAENFKVVIEKVNTGCYYTTCRALEAAEVVPFRLKGQYAAEHFRDKTDRLMSDGK